LSLDLQEDSLDLVTGAGNLPLHLDRQSVLRFSVDGTVVTGLNVIEAGAVFSLGLDAFGARTAEDATPVLPLSRDGADAEFRKLEVSARWRRQLGERLSFALSGRAQTSFGDPLTSSEQFGIAAI